MSNILARYLRDMQSLGGLNPMQRAQLQGTTPESVAANVAALRQNAPPPSSPISGMNTLQAQQNMAFPVAPPQMPRGPAASPQAAVSSPPPAPMGPPHTVPENRMGSDNIFDNPEAVGTILGMGDLNRRLAFAEKLRDTSMPEGRYVSGGRIYTAASPFEHLATGYGKYRGAKSARSLGQDITKAKEKIIELLRNKS